MESWIFSFLTMRLWPMHDEFNQSRVAIVNGIEMDRTRGTEPNGANIDDEIDVKTRRN